MCGLLVLCRLLLRQLQTRQLLRQLLLLLLLLRLVRLLLRQLQLLLLLLLLGRRRAGAGVLLAARQVPSRRLLLVDAPGPEARRQLLTAAWSIQRPQRLLQLAAASPHERLQVGPRAAVVAHAGCTVV